MTNPSSLISRLEVVPIREAFKHEAHHFTRWLEEHIEALEDRIGIKMTVIQREKDVGDFNVDLLCEDENGHAIIIENQLERTDHNHLGQLLTYLVNLDAKTAIWIATEPRPEHKRVIDWLNESTPADVSFYLIKVEAIRIKESPYAPLFTVLVAPDNQAKIVGEKKKEWANSHLQREEFWKSLLERSKKSKTSLFSAVSPGRYEWIGTGAGRTGISYIFRLKKSSAEINLYIDSKIGEKNKQIFDELAKNKDEIENTFGDKLEWDRGEDKRSSLILKRFQDGGLATPEKWEELQDKLVDGMDKFHKAIDPTLSKIKL